MRIVSGTCRYCEQAFTLARWNQRYCSNRCKQARARRDNPFHGQSCQVVYGECRGCGSVTVGNKHRSWCGRKCKMNPASPFACLVCRKYVRPGENGVHHQAHLYCSSECRLKAERQRRGKRHAARDRAIFERDGLICHICWEPLERDEIVPHPLAPTIDHIIPVSKGGGNEEANKQAAHYRCNVLKGDRLPLGRAS